MLTVAGLATARGFALGPVFLYRGDGEISIPEYVVAIGDEEAELERFRRAVAAVKRDLEGIIAALRERAGREDVRIFECHLMILEDPSMAAETERHIAVEHINAEAAVKSTVGKYRERFARMNDPYFRERVRDLDDIERRLMHAFLGTVQSPLTELKVPSIIVAEDLTPSETVQLPRDCVLGFVTNGGSTTSHVALLARAMGIPAVTGVGDITERVRPGMTILLDGTNGAVTVNPDERAIQEFTILVKRQQEHSDAAAEGPPAGTLADGGKLSIFANVHPGVPVAGVKAFGARGIGLYRSEYLWLNSEREPTEDEQFAAYQRAAHFASSLGPDAAVTIRTLDIGGDKMMRGISSHEANPFLGNRSIRFLLSHPDIFRTQLRAILRASAFGHIHMMHPMVSCVEELTEAAAILADVKRELDSAGIAYDKSIPVGAMIEVPAAAVNAEALARHVDFFSVGTNDLVQYTMAADRGNEAVSHLYQPLNPAVLELMRRTIAAAKNHGIPVSVCGESASDPVVGVLWAGMGVDVLSMSATYIPVMSNVLRRLTRADLANYAAFALGMDADKPAKEIYDACRNYLATRIPDLDDVLI